MLVKYSISHLYRYYYCTITPTLSPSALSILSNHGHASPLVCDTIRIAFAVLDTAVFVQLDCDDNTDTTLRIYSLDASDREV